MVVRWLSFASEQLQVDMQYVVDNFGERTAKKSLRKILDKVNNLKKYPEIGVLDRKFSTKEIKVRHLNIGPNMVFYLIDANEVVVISIMHCKQSSYVISRAIMYALGKYAEE